MSDEPGAPGAEEPDAPGTEDEPIPPGMEETGDIDAGAVLGAGAAPQEAAAAPPDGTTVATSAAAPVDEAAAYAYYGQPQAAAAYPGYGEQYAGYDQYYGYWPGYGDASGYDPYAGYYNADGTAYAYDPSAYTAPEATAAPAEAGAAAATHTEAITVADPSAAAVADPSTQAAITPAPTNSTPAAPPADTGSAAPASADQADGSAADASGLSGEHAANLLSVAEKANLEQQQDAAEVARKEAEEKFQKAEEQRRNAKVKADEQAAMAAAAHAHAQAEAQAELHRQLQQRLVDAQAASVAQEAEKEKRRAQPVTLKGARLAFTAPKAPGKAAAAPQTGDQSTPPGFRKPDMTVKLEPKPQPPAASRVTAKAEPPGAVPAKKPGQLFLPQPSTVKNAYLLMAQNKKSAAAAADKGGPPARQLSPPRPLSPRRRATPPRSPPRWPPSPGSEDERSRQRSFQEASKKVKGRGNRRYRPDEGGPMGVGSAPGPMDGMDRRERDEHRSKHKHRHHKHRHRDRDGDGMDPADQPPNDVSPNRHAGPADRAAPSRYVPPPYDQSVDPQATNGRPGQALFPGAFASYNPPLNAKHAPSRQQPPMQQPQAFDHRHDRYAASQQQAGLHGAYPSHTGQAPGQGSHRQPSVQALVQPPAAASGLPTLSDSSDDDDELPLPGSGSMRAMSVLQKYLSGSGAAAEAPATAAATTQSTLASAAATIPAPRSVPVVKAASYSPTESVAAQSLAKPKPQGRAPLQQAPPPVIAASGYSSDSDHSQLNGNIGNGLSKRMGGTAGTVAPDDMDMSPILDHDKSDSLDATALAKLPAQLREAAAAAMARHKAELPSQPMERAIDIPGGPAGRQVQHAKRAQRQYRQRGGEEELEGDAGFNALPNQAAGMAAATRMQEMEHEARARAKRARGDEARDAEASDDGKRRSKKHKKHHKKEKKEKDRSSRREHEASPVAPPQLYSQDRRFAKPPQDSFNRRPDYPPQQQQQQTGFNRQGSYNQQQGFHEQPGLQRKPGFNQEQGYGARPDFNQRQQSYAREVVPPRKRRQFSDRQTVSRSRSRSRSRSGSYSKSRSRSYSRSPSHGGLSSLRRYNRSVTPPPRRTFGLKADQQCPAPAPVHGIPPPGSGPAPPSQPPPQPYGGPPPVSSFPPSSGAFGHMAPNPLAGMFQPLPAAPPANPMLMNQQAAAEKAAKAAKRLYVGNIPFEATQAELIAFFDSIMADTGALAADTEEQGSAVTSCTLYDRSSAAAGPKAKYAFLNLRSVEETSNCVAFDGVYLKANSLKVRRPDDYDAKKVADMGPSEPSHSLNSLVLSQLKRPPPPPLAPILPPAPALGPSPSGEVEDGEVAVAAPVVTRALKLEHMVARDELLDDEEYSDILDDITEEIETKYGHITSIAIPRPRTPQDTVSTGVGFVFVAFEDMDAASKAQKALHGRMFGDNKIDASYYNEAQMTQKIFI